MRKNKIFVKKFIRQTCTVNITYCPFLATKWISRENENTLKVSDNKLPDLCSLHHSYSGARCQTLFKSRQAALGLPSISRENRQTGNDFCLAFTKDTSLISTSHWQFWLFWFTVDICKYNQSTETKERSCGSHF